MINIISELTPAKNFPHNPVCTIFATNTKHNNPAACKIFRGNRLRMKRLNLKVQYKKSHT